MEMNRETLLLRLAMDHEDIEISGMAGEFCAHWVFDAAEVAWIALGQEPGHYSAVLKAQRAHRPDYLIASNGASLFIDVKTYRTLRGGGPGIRRFGVLDSDWEDLHTTCRITGVPVGLLFWDKRDYGRFRFGLCLLDDLTGTHLDEDQRSWRSIDVPVDRMSTFSAR